MSATATIKIKPIGVPDLRARKGRAPIVNLTAYTSPKFVKRFAELGIDLEAAAAANLKTGTAS